MRLCRQMTLTCVSKNSYKVYYKRNFPVVAKGLVARLLPRSSMFYYKQWQKEKISSKAEKQ